MKKKLSQKLVSKGAKEAFEKRIREDSGSMLNHIEGERFDDKFLKDDRRMLNYAANVLSPDEMKVKKENERIDIWAKRQGLKVEDYEIARLYLKEKKGENARLIAFVILILCCLGYVIFYYGQQMQAIGMLKVIAMLR